jgi:hypothetical protein
MERYKYFTAVIMDKNYTLQINKPGFQMLCPNYFPDSLHVVFTQRSFQHVSNNLKLTTLHMK